MMDSRILLKLPAYLKTATTKEARRWGKSTADYIREALADRIDTDQKWDPDPRAGRKPKNKKEK